MLMVQALTGKQISSTLEAFSTTQFTEIIANNSSAKRDLYYFLKYLPCHFLQTGSFNLTAELLADCNFIRKRFQIFGPHAATQMQISDLYMISKNNDLIKTNRNRHHVPVPQSQSTNNEMCDMQQIYHRVLRLTRDEVYATESSLTFYSPVLGLCMICIGEALLNGDNARDAICRFDEAAGIYRFVPGSYELDVAKSLDACARACIKIGEECLALVKYEEAWRIYQESKDPHSYDAIQNSLHLKDLLVSLGFNSDAEIKYERALMISIRGFGEESERTGKICVTYTFSIQFYL